MEDTRGRVALITGASRGLGLALARAMARQGWTLIINGRNADALEAARQELAKETQVVAVAGDVADRKTREGMLDALHGLRVDGLDALINNASILGPSPQPRLLDYPLDILETVYRVNVFAPLALIQDLRLFLRTGACIINVSSDAAVEAYEGWGGYGSSKAALDHLTAILAAEETYWNVYSVDPGDMRTQMHQEAFPGEDISDRPLPEERVPGILTLLDGALPGGRYVAAELAAKATAETEAIK